MDSEIPIPHGAIGRVGQLAALHGIAGLQDGRLGLVRHPVGWVRELIGAHRPTFGWQVLLTGSPVVIDGRERQEIIVADACLRPISRLAADELAQCVAQEERERAEAAAQAVRAQISDEAMEAPDFQRLLHLACGTAQINYATETVGAVEVLREVGFRASTPDQDPNADDCLVWVTAWEGAELKVVAAPGWLGQWHLAAFAVRARSAHCPETLILDDWPRGRILQAMLELWESVFGRRVVPQSLELGWVYRQHQRDLKSLEPGLYVDGVELRRALRWLREAIESDPMLEGPPADAPVELLIQDGVLRVRALGHDLAVRLGRGWLNGATLSLRHFLSLPSSAVRGYWLPMNLTEGGLRIGAFQVPRWAG